MFVQHSHEDGAVLTAGCPACSHAARKAEAAAEVAAVMSEAPVAEVTARWKIGRGGPVQVSFPALLQIPVGWAADVAADWYLNDLRGVEAAVAGAPARAVTVTAIVRGRTVSGESTLSLRAPADWPDDRIVEHHVCDDVWASQFIADNADDVTEMAEVESLSFVFDDPDVDGRDVLSCEDLIVEVFEQAVEGLVDGATLDRFRVLSIDRDSERLVRVECDGQLDIFATASA